MKIDRLLSIIVYMLNHDLVSARVLAERFEVTVRTIQRDMEVIELAGIPIMSIQGPNGGYAIMENFKLNSQLLSVEDLYYVITSLKSVSDTLSDKRIDGTLEKMKTLLPSHESDFLAGRDEKLSIDFSLLGGDPRQQASFRTVKEAVDSERLLRFTYTNNRMEKKTRTVEPMTIAFKWRSWYLYGWCRNREAYRIFRISRIREPEILPERFKRRGFSYEEFQREQEEKGPGNMTDLTLRFDASMRPLVEEYHSPEETEEGPEGSLIIRTAMPEDGWMYGFILSYGQYVTVLEPPHVREIIRDGAEKIAAKYK